MFVSEPMGEGQPTNGKCHSVKHKVEDQADYMVFHADFRECIDHRETKENPGQDHHSTSGASSKCV
jgi:hypothetical protein